MEMFSRFTTVYAVWCMHTAAPAADAVYSYLLRRRRNDTVDSMVYRPALDE